MDLTRLRDSRSFRVLVRLGLVSYGVVHLVTAGLALQVAFGITATASSRGALREVAHDPLGIALVWSMGIGLLVLALWQVVEGALDLATVGRWTRRWARRSACLGRALTYLALGLLALGTAVTARDTQRSRNLDVTVTAEVLHHPVGPLLVSAVGLGVAVAGVAEIIRGARRRFAADLTRAAGRPTVVFGVVGFTAKGLVLVLIGALLVAAGISHDPSDVGGMDIALAQLRERRFGAELLAAMAAGLACFGLYCFVWAGRARI